MEDKLLWVINQLKLNTKPQIRQILRKKFILLPYVFDPVFFDSKLLAKNINKIKFNGNVLDLGTGCGIQAIFSSKYANKITAADINQYALENTKLNIDLYNLNNKIQVIKSDLFSNISGKFNLIIFNPPFFSKRPKTIIEKSVTDYKNSLINRFFKEVKNYLSPNGKIIMVVSNILNLNLFNQIIIKSGLNFKIIDKKKFNFDEYLVYLIKK